MILSVGVAAAPAMASWTPPITVSPKPGPQGPYVAEFPKVAIDNSGNAVFVWKAFSYSCDIPSGVFARVALQPCA